MKTLVFRDGTCAFSTSNMYNVSSVTHSHYITSHLQDDRYIKKEIAIKTPHQVKSGKLDQHVASVVQK